MANGFLGYDATFMLDLIVCLLVLVVPWLAYSIYIVKFKARHTLHRNLQIGLGIALLVTVVAFEVDMQLVHGGWERVVNKQPESPRLTGADFDFVRKLLWIHLVFAVTTPILWTITLVQALRRFGSPPKPGIHSRTHKLLGWASAIDITLTSITGLVFYYFAFMK